MKWQLLLLALIIAFFSCKPNPKLHTGDQEIPTSEKDFEWEVDRFADIKILRYTVDGFDKLSLKQKKYVYYLSQAGLSGRDIIYDTNYRHNLRIRKAIESVIDNLSGKESGEDWDNFMVFAKQFFFANGLHHHYSMDKFKPNFGEDYFRGLLKKAGTSMSDKSIKAIFDPTMDIKKVSLDSSGDLVLNSAVNFYGPNVTQADVENFYKSKTKNDGNEPISHGLNSQLVKENGKLKEKVWHANGMYGSAIKEMIVWLEKAAAVAENESQTKALNLLIKYYQSGDLVIWDDYNIEWAKSTAGDIDYITGFVEVYNDPMGYKGSYETIVQINDFDASARMKVLSDNIQWFEDQSPTMEAHKKKNVKGVSYKVVNVAAEAGDASPSTPIGVNLPNANWIRAKHGSKSVSLGNIISAYDEAAGPGLLGEFAHDEEEIERSKNYGGLADKMGTALHEVLGHASGQIEQGVGTPKETLKNYASTLEEARADIFSLYYILDPKLVELGLFENLDAGKTEYDSYISNGLMKQLRRLEIGKDVEESHMRNRQLIASWAYEKGKAENVIEKVMRDGKTYFNINDYKKLRTIFGQLLREIQRIKSQGDYEAGQALVEDYGVKVGPKLHQEVIDRTKDLNTKPFSGFINPEYELITNNGGEISDVKLKYPTDFLKQMMDYGKKYAFLPTEN